MMLSDRALARVPAVSAPIDDLHAPVHPRLASLLSAVLLAGGLSACSSVGGESQKPSAPGTSATAPAQRPGWVLGMAPAPTPTTPTAPQPVASGVSSPTAVIPGSATASAPTAAQATPQQPSFDAVIKGAERQDGLLPIWKRQDKVWIELRPDAFGKPFFLSPKLASGIGEAGVFGGMMQSRWAQVGRPQWIEFRKVQQQVQLLAINAAFTAEKGSPQARAVQAAFSPSLLGSVPLASAPQPQSGAVLVEANLLLLSDLLGVAQQLQRSYRQSYGLDVRNSVLTEARADAQTDVFEVSQHFATAGIAAPTPGQPPGMPTSTVPLSVPDPRSLFITVHYSLSALPDKPMATRPADPRVGYFTTTVADFTDDLARTPRKRFINRWRLEKKDATSPLSEPVRPIVFWLDPSIPEGYRPAITEGILEWNKAFEAIGFKNAIQVRTPPSDKPFDTLETGHTAIRWMTNSAPVFGAIGPTHVDPRTGEILDADIGLESLSSRAIRTIRSQFVTRATLPSGPPSEGLISMGALDVDGQDAGARNDPGACLHAAAAAEQLGLGLDLLETQGLLDPDSPRVREFVLAYLKDTTMHEVGHTLGLRHNFRGSRWHTAEQLSDLALTRSQGNSASVMDYAPINLPAPGEAAGAPFQTTLGPYDYWAIEYGYKPLPADQVEARQALRAIADRSADPAMAEALAFGTDEDNALGLDPQSLTFDLGRDPVAFARRRLALTADLIHRQASRQLTPADDPTLPRRSIAFALRDMARTAQVLLRQVGGVVTRRDAPPSRRDLLDPLPATQQRAALDVLADAYLSPRAINLPPALQRQLAPDYLERQEGGDGHSDVPTDFSLAEQRLAIQRAILGYLMAEGLAERLLDNIDKTRDRERHPFTVRELHRRLMDAVWRDGPVPPGAESGRRDLQRDYVNRLAAAVVRNASGRADVRALLRAQASSLLKQLKAQRNGAADSAANAHRQDCIDTLSKALAAAVVRPTP